MKFHEKIRFMRQSKNWSQEDMADKLGMSVAGYAKIEQGRTDANFSKLEQIASVFDMDIVELLSFGEKNVICLIGDNSVNISQIIGSSKDLAYELQKLQLMVEHKDEMMTQKDKEIAGLKEVVALLKAQAA
ncbi:MAG: helix-turn-helix transcriptional regulator [Methylococcales bacterium]|nr:helix-turn-helix transcriptional regulator [Methylococcales bacterium]MDP3839978.1 helix-turn-helix transcriptional regulator [Methylococcales bacterium]